MLVATDSVEEEYQASVEIAHAKLGLSFYHRYAHVDRRGAGFEVCAIGEAGESNLPERYEPPRVEVAWAA